MANRKCGDRASIDDVGLGHHFCDFCGLCDFVAPSEVADLWIDGDCVAGDLCRTGSVESPRISFWCYAVHTLYLWLLAMLGVLRDGDCLAGDLLLQQGFQSPRWLTHLDRNVRCPAIVLVGSRRRHGRGLPRPCQTRLDTREAQALGLDRRVILSARVDEGDEAKPWASSVFLQSDQ